MIAPAKFQPGILEVQSTVHSGKRNVNLFEK